MARFAVTGEENAVTGSPTTALSLVSAATIRPAVDYFTGSAGAGTLADQSVRLTVSRFTAVPTVTAVTPQSLGADGSVSELASGTGENASAEGAGQTTGSEMYDQAIHLRSQAYWWASSEGARLIMPATALNGIGYRVIQASGAYVGPWGVTSHHVE